MLVKSRRNELNYVKEQTEISYKNPTNVSVLLFENKNSTQIKTSNMGR